MSSAGSPHLARERASGALVVGGAALGVAALAVVLLRQQPGLLALVPFGLAGGLLAVRAPELVLLGALVLAGFEGTLQAHAGIRAEDLVQATVAVLVIGAVLRILLGVRRDAMVLLPGVLLLAAFVALSGAYAAVSESATLGRRGFAEAAMYMLAALALLVSLEDERARRRAVWGIVVITGAVSAYGVFRYVVGPTVEELALAQQGGRTTGSNVMVNGEPAAFGSLRTRGGLARWAAAGTLFALAVALFSRGGLRIACVPAIVLGPVAMFATQTRIAAVALGAGCICVLLLHHLARAKPSPRLGVTAGVLVLVVAGGAAAFAATVGTDEGSSARFGDILAPGEARSLQVREARWADAMRVVEREPFGLGIGTAGRSQSDARYRTFGVGGIDNNYLQVLIELGWPGLLMLVLALVALIVGFAHRGAVTSDPARAGPAIGAAAVLLMMMVLMWTGLSLGGVPALLPFAMAGVASACLAYPEARSTLAGA